MPEAETRKNYMTIIKVNEGKFLNMERMTYTEPSKNGGMYVYFAVGGGDVGGPSCYMKLDQSEALLLQEFLDAQKKKAST
jgi:hypothetical protein